MDYATILFEKETLWYRKSRCKWISLGDHNITYFYLSTIAIRRRNHILALKDASNDWADEPKMIKNMVKEFFTDLYCEHSS